MIPVGYERGKCNPNYEREKEDAYEMEGLELMKYHWENVDYAQNKRKKKPIYLI